MLSVSSNSSLPVFLGFGLLACFSTCAALVGGITLSMNKQWSEVYTTKDSMYEKLQPHLLFNLGRVASFSLMGVLLGLAGRNLQTSPLFTSVLTMAASVLMILLGLQMVGVKRLQRFQLALPKTITRFVADENNFRAKWMPFLIGSLTLILPCGFTITSQSLALISGSPLRGGLIMTAFVLGTIPPLLLIGFSSVKFSSKPHLGSKFLKVAGVLVLLFGFYNFNAQLNVLGFKSLSDVSKNECNA